MPAPPRLSLVIPAYNEAAGIAESVVEAHEALARLGYEFELLIVDDGSTDETATRVREVARTWPRVRLIAHDTNRGYGAALRTGFEAARYELVAFTDADGQFFIEELDDLITLTRRFPIVVGWRVDRQDPWRRRFLSWGYNVLVRTLLGTGVRDCDCALKVFRREALAYLLPESAGFFVNSEMLCRARQFGWRVAEVGVRHRPRRRGTSKVSLAEVPRNLATLARFWWRHVFRAKPVPAPVFAEPVVLPFPRSAPATVHRAA
jgi:glycosyltransferase involved in cell wall biosynthesis